MRHPCIECGQVFPFPYLLRDHMRLHTGEQPFVCGICNKTFSRVNSLISHQRTHMPPPPQPSTTIPFPCARCPKVFSSELNLRKHFENHLRTKLLACEFCSATFTRKSSLDVHVRMHGSEDDLLCVRCKRPFGTDVAKLVLHMESHGGRRRLRT